MEPDFRNCLATLLIAAVLLLAAGAVPVASAQEQDVRQMLEQIEILFSAEDVDGIVAISSDPLDIASFGATRTYSHTQGSYVLEDVFEDIEIRDFSVTGHREAANGVFIEGRVAVPPSARPIRIYVRMKKSADRWTVREILFERIDQQD